MVTSNMGLSPTIAKDESTRLKDKKMRLSTIHHGAYPILDGIILLYGGLLTEDRRELSWPEEWADRTLQDPRFQAWLQSLGVEGEVGRPMAGGVGRAYPIGSEHIVKFTIDSKEANAAAVLKGHDSPHAANVYDVKRVFSIDDPKTGRRRSLFVIAMQRLNTGVGKKMRAAGNAVYSYLDDNAGFIEDPESVVKVVLARYLDPRSKADPSMPGLVKKVVDALYDVQERTGVLSQDPHGGNMAFKGREPAFFDFGRSSTNFEHPKTAGARVTSLS